MCYMIVISSVVELCFASPTEGLLTKGDLKPLVDFQCLLAEFIGAIGDISNYEYSELMGL